MKVWTKSFRWDLKPDPGLTWSLSLHSGSWGESAPPCQCGGRWADSLSGCSGSAVPLRGSAGSFLLGGSSHTCLQNATLWAETQMHAEQHSQICENTKLTIADSQECQEHHERCEEDSAAHDWGVYNKRGWRFFFWKFSNEAKTSEQVSFWFLGFPASPSLAQRCCLNQVLKCQAFIAVLEMSHFPKWGALRKTGFLLVKREFTVR